MGRRMDLMLNELRLLFDQGSILAWTIERCAFSKGWLVYFYTRAYPNTPCYLLDTRRHERREFNSLDSAVSAVEKVGFEVKKVTNA